ncbi:hypothetical protein [Dokdonia sp. Hel_I_53]|uniref:hypothetical protein n=1 Tax=Dokdonia sp. Hel_I_53 TaxID=1566287 RepID=UPI00119A7666|nr:hypothetical protein [Dokdonia sp. Hel_I_53]TVZ51609.1 hypothetical protein OD90_0757 [Dokdonia sp. Hel_I_53]
MYVSDSNIKHTLEDVYILDIGTFYFFEKFVISEFNEGVTVNWESVQEILTIAESHYGVDSKLFYISNRINSYSLYPQDWLKFFKVRNYIHALAIVTYRPIEKTNILLEKLFFKNNIKKFNSLTLAIDWAMEAQNSYQKKSVT